MPPDALRNRSSVETPSERTSLEILSCTDRRCPQHNRPQLTSLFRSCRRRADMRRHTSPPSSSSSWRFSSWAPVAPSACTSHHGKSSSESGGHQRRSSPLPASSPTASANSGRENARTVDAPGRHRAGPRPRKPRAGRRGNEYANVDGHRLDRRRHLIRDLLGIALSSLLRRRRVGGIERRDDLRAVDRWHRRRPGRDSANRDRGPRNLTQGIAAHPLRALPGGSGSGGGHSAAASVSRRRNGWHPTI